MPTRVHYRHDNPAYLRPAFVHDGVEVPATEMPGEDDVHDFDDFLTDSSNEAEEDCSQLHWNDVDFHILSTENISLEVMNGG